MIFNKIISELTITVIMLPCQAVISVEIQGLTYIQFKLLVSDCGMNRYGYSAACR